MAVKPVIFTNWSGEDFSWAWDGIPFLFRAGSSIYLEEPKARHFAKHLTDRELIREKKQVNDQNRESFENRCFGTVPEEAVVGPDTGTQLANLNRGESAERFCLHCDSLGMRHKKDCRRDEPIS